MGDKLWTREPNPGPHWYREHDGSDEELCTLWDDDGVLYMSTAGTLDNGAFADRSRWEWSPIPSPEEWELVRGLARMTGEYKGVECVWCKKVVMPSTPTHEVPNYALESHVMECAEHPAQKLYAENERLQAVASAASEYLDHGTERSKADLCNALDALEKSDG